MITSQCNDFVCGAEGLESTKHILDGYLFLTRPFSVGGEFWTQSVEFPGVSKSIRLHVGIFRFFLHSIGIY